MHSIEELGTNVPAFLAKLWKIVEDPETNDLICWSPGGTSFFIRNQARFARELLPLYYKHNNMASFVRQLNMYGFHKVVSIEGGGLRVDKDEMEFAHQYFLSGHPYLLEHIKRKIPTSKVEEGRTGAKPELVNKVLADVKSMKGRQDSLDTQLNSMKRENEVLWREVAILRQKHLKQQQIVNKLIQFLVSMVQSSRNGGIGIKRHYPLMLNDTSHRPSKISKLGAELSDLNNAPSSMSPTGPVIHELDAADLLDECEPNTEETPAEENFLPSELCNAEITPVAEQQPSPSSNSNQGVCASPDPNISNPSPEVLLELAEECPLSPSMLLSASPMEVDSSVVPRLNKGKLRRAGSSESKKRKSKKLISKNKDATVPTDSLSEEDTGDNGVDLLDVLPTLVDETTLDDKTSDLLQPETSDNSTEVKRTEDALASESLAAATDAAITAISSVAAASKNLSPSAPVSSGKSVKDKTLNRKKLVLNIPNKASFATTSAGKNITGKTQLKSNDAMVFKQEPSTSNETEFDPSNMILACTGNSMDENNFNRCGVPNELDSHVDTMQSELDTLRDILKGEGYSLDANTLLGLFSEDPMSELQSATFENIPEEQEKNTTGNELATYSSNLLDMVDMFEGTGPGEWSTPITPDSSNIMDVSLSELNTPQMAVVCPSEVSKKK